MNFKPNITAGLLSATAVSVMVLGSPAIAQSALNGDYADLTGQIATATEAADAAATTASDAQVVLDEANTAYAALEAQITPEEQELLNAVISAQEVADATGAELISANEELNLAQTALLDAQDAADVASGAYNTAIQDRIAAEDALALEPTNFILAEALVEAQAAEDLAQQEFLTAIAALPPLDADVVAATAVVEAADLADLAAREDLGLATAAAATVTPSTGEFALAQADLDLAQTSFTEASDALNAANDQVASLTRADEVLNVAATSPNEAIADAAGALLGDVTDTNAEVEIIAALDDHETRITDNAAAIVAGDAATLASANSYTDTSVAAEAELRVAGDAALSTRISAEETARIAADAAESNARIAADNALGNRITNETNERIAADNVLRDQIASSTATAIALGGAAILPDVNFTLSANMGFYEGAQAVAINGAARVAPNTYFTGAIGGGLNKRGSVGGRVGVVFGF